MFMERRWQPTKLFDPRRIASYTSVRRRDQCASFIAVRNGMTDGRARKLPDPALDR